MTLDEKIAAIQDRFDALHERLSADSEAYICRCPVEERTLYFVHDVHGITINAGLGAWIYYHGQSYQQQEVVEAIAAFRRLGLDTAAEAITKLLYLYRQNGNRMPEEFDDRIYSAAIWDHTDAIYSRLWDYLQDNAPKA